MGPPGLLFGTLPSGLFESEEPLLLAGFVDPPASSLGVAVPGIAPFLEALEIPIFFPIVLELGFVRTGLFAGSVCANATPKESRKTTNKRILFIRSTVLYFRKLSTEHEEKMKKNGHPLDDHFSFSYSAKAATPGSTFPSICSNNAPPPVDT